MLKLFNLVILIEILSSRPVQKFRFKTSVFNMPGPGKEEKGGEDAWFDDDRLICVADGVGGWIRSGVDPAVYSKSLMKFIEQLFKADPDAYSNKPINLGIDAGRMNRNIGSCTLVCATVHTVSNNLITSNLGDSGFAIFRKNKDKFEKLVRSKEQLHSFNFPFQMGTSGDDPVKADMGVYQIKEGDLIIMASDGLFDNLYDDDLVRLVNPKESLSLQKMVDKIGLEAYYKSKDPRYLSPFARNARNQNFAFQGGKADDITIIIAEIVLEKQLKTPETEQQSNPEASPTTDEL